MKSCLFRFETELFWPFVQHYNEQRLILSLIHIHHCNGEIRKIIERERTSQ